MFQLLHGDCIEQMRAMPDNSVDAIVTDPPYGLEFMGKDWDSFKTYAGGNPNLKPQGSTAEHDGDSDFAATSYGYRQKNPRCRRCGKLKRGNGSCKCPSPMWDTRTAESAFQFQAFTEDWAREAWRVLKPGGHLLAFGGTRTWHRLAAGIEDAGFEIRDQIMWLYGSGFPKSLDVSKAIDKGSGENRARQLRFTAWMRATGITSRQIDEITGTNMGGHYLSAASQPAIATADLFDLLRPHLPEVPEEIDRLVAERTGIEWTAYKNREVVGIDRRFNEPSGIVNVGQGQREFIDRKITAPATDAAREWQGWGTALKPAHEPIVVARKPLNGTVAANVLAYGTGALNIDGCRVGYASDNDKDKALAGDAFKRKDTSDAGWSRPWMADEERVARMNAEAKERAQAGRWPANVIHDGSDEVTALFGEPARFFYCAKASKRDRNEGTERNGHPTVKPTDLMRYLVRLVTPPNGTVLDPFTGSGSTGKACMYEGFQFIGIEQDADYIEIARARITWAWEQAVEAAVNPQPDLFDDTDDMEASA